MFKKNPHKILLGDLHEARVSLVNHQASAEYHVLQSQLNMLEAAQASARADAAQRRIERIEAVLEAQRLARMPKTPPKPANLHAVKEGA
jgi:hypothetical protein